jgi:flagellar biosynthesis anti-sigma factor FlgM
MLRRLILIVMFALPGMAFAQRPPLVVPERADAIVERLPKGYAALTPERPVITAAGRLAQAQRLLATAARTGDARLATRAEALLAGSPTGDATPAVLLARAYAAQHRHDFDHAVDLLDRLVRTHPRDAAARLTRLSTSLADQPPPVDVARVAALRTAIGSGNYGVHPAIIASAMLDFHGHGTE